MNHLCPFCNKEMSNLDIRDNKEVSNKKCVTCTDPRYFTYNEYFYVCRTVKDLIWQIIYHPENYYSIVTIRNTLDIPPVSEPIFIVPEDNSPHSALKVLDRIIKMRMFT